MEWTSLTRLPVKAQLYGWETYFREGLADARLVLGEHLASALWHAALLVIKGDGLVSGKATTIVDFLRTRGFAIVAVELPALTRFQWRELWRYQLAAASLDRLAVNDLILRNRMLLLLLRHEGPLDVPASVWLGSLKGPADVALQPPDCLRRRLAQPNRLFSAFHVADEPADLLRELAILFDVPARRRLLSVLAGPHRLSPAEQQVLDETLAASDRSARALDAQASLDRLERVMRDVPGEAAARVRTDLATMRRGEPIAWRPFTDAVSATAIDVDRWDLATLGATFVVHDEPGMSKLIGNVDASAWR
ncbi:MAG: nucleoside-diphosphate kinase [Thermoanaerobaculia bacterium]